MAKLRSDLHWDVAYQPTQIQFVTVCHNYAFFTIYNLLPSIN
jgi:hypothetical protein